MTVAKDPPVVAVTSSVIDLDGSTLDDLIERSRALTDATPEDDRVHARHAQRASFVYGNVALSWRDATRGQLDELRAACVVASGPCPCRSCASARTTPAEST
jgi:hypothetical protein